MGIPGSLFYRPHPQDPFGFERYGRMLETPIGVAAGPHTQLSGNIIAAWLCGARYIELKTVQTLDDLDVPKPCIDMQDEGYNCEWSQELRIRESFTEYLNAWIIIHILRKELGFNGSSGTLLNMSVGYNLEGILNDNVQWFLGRMKNCSAELIVAKEMIRNIYPAIDDIRIPVCISDHITLSTMHGCPPDEIEKIGLYLIREQNLHTTIKLNPTLLGPGELRGLLNTELGYPTEVPDLAFDHDLKYPDALRILNSLSVASLEKGLQFGIKLTNTLESVNHKDVFGKSETMMYMSGRALHPISIRLARKLQKDFAGNLDISFSAGADCFNITDVIACGMKPVTVCSDLLKPGGYGRLHQYIENLRSVFALNKAHSIDDFIVNVSGSGNNLATKNAKHGTNATFAGSGLSSPNDSEIEFDINDLSSVIRRSSLRNLRNYTDRVADNPAYQKKSTSDPSIKTSRKLGWFDCIHAPCIDTCPANQDIPEYLHHTATGNISAAFETILQTNPFPSVTGMVCDHLCQLKCTRINYDDPLQIREIKRYVSESVGDNSRSDAISYQLDATLQNSETRGSALQHSEAHDSALQQTETPGSALQHTETHGSTLRHTETHGSAKPGKQKAAIIGAGPAGLSCGWFLRKAGFDVDVFEQQSIPGGMVSAAIPSFRLTSVAIENDIQRILASGIHLHDNHAIDLPRFEDLRREYDAIFLAAGAQKSVKLKIDGVESTGVIDPLDFLFDIRQNRKTPLGRHVVIIGGGNTAMDAARTAFRLVGNEGTVTIVYRRTIKEMPADKGEIESVKAEGIKIIELTNPVRIQSAGGQVTGLVCSRNELSVKAMAGRPIPVAIPGTEFVIPCDTIIPAIGQQLEVNFLEQDQLTTIPGNYKTQIPKLYIGGDALRGASTAINAIGDGRKAAAEIIAETLHPSVLLNGTPPRHHTSRLNGTSPLHTSPLSRGGEGGEDFQVLLHRKATREYGIHPAETVLDNRQNFDLVISSLSVEQATKEASRCLQCDVICNVCVSVCPNLANFGYQVEPVYYLLQKAILKEDGTIKIEPDKDFRVDQQFQILNIRDLCNECGNCTTFCPTSGRPFADKPGICLSVKSLNAEGTGFFLSRLPDKQVLIYKEKENIRTLSLENGHYIYETNQVKAVINPDDFSLLDVKFLTPCVKEFHFEFAAEMSIIMRGAMQVSLFER